MTYGTFRSNGTKQYKRTNFPTKQKKLFGQCDNSK